MKWWRGLFPWGGKQREEHSKYRAILEGTNGCSRHISRVPSSAPPLAASLAWMCKWMCAHLAGTPTAVWCSDTSPGFSSSWWSSPQATPWISETAADKCRWWWGGSGCSTSVSFPCMNTHQKCNYDTKLQVLQELAVPEALWRLATGASSSEYGLVKFNYVVVWRCFHGKAWHDWFYRRSMRTCSPSCMQQLGKERVVGHNIDRLVGLWISQPLHCVGNHGSWTLIYI